MWMEVWVVQHLLTCACVSEGKSILWHKQMITHNQQEAGADPERWHQSPCQPHSALAFLLDNLAPTASSPPLAVYGLKLQGNCWNKQVEWQQRWEETRSLEKTALGIFFIAVRHCCFTQNLSNKFSGCRAASCVCALCLDLTNTITKAFVFFLFNTENWLRWLSRASEQVIPLIVNLSTLVDLSDFAVLGRSRSLAEA